MIKQEIKIDVLPDNVIQLSDSNNITDIKFNSLSELNEVYNKLAEHSTEITYKSSVQKISINKVIDSYDNEIYCDLNFLDLKPIELPLPENVVSITKSQHFNSIYTKSTDYTEILKLNADYINNSINFNYISRVAVISIVLLNDVTIYQIVIYGADCYKKIEKNVQPNINLPIKQFDNIFGVEYDYIEQFTNGVARVELNNKQGYITDSGVLICPIIYNYVSDFAEDIAIVKLNNKYGYINSKGDKLTEVIYDDVSKFHNGVACVQIDSKYGFIDITGKILYPFNLQHVKEEIDGVCIVEDDNKYGMLDITKFELICPIIYDRINNFENGFARIKLNGKYGFINKQGKEICEIKYDLVLRFINGYAQVHKADKILFIDENGNELTEIPTK